MVKWPASFFFVFLFPRYAMYMPCSFCFFLMLTKNSGVAITRYCASCLTVLCAIFMLEVARRRSGSQSVAVEQLSCCSSSFRRVRVFKSTSLDHLVSVPDNSVNKRHCLLVDNRKKKMRIFVLLIFTVL